MSIKVASPRDLNNTSSAEQESGLSFEVRECGYDCDHVFTPGSPISPISPISPLYDQDTIPPLMRSTSCDLTSPTAASDRNISKPQFQCSPAMATADGMYAPPAIRSHPNVKRLQFGDNRETVETLKFLESQGFNTTALVTQHIAKYNSRARIAQTNDGEIVGFAMFDNEIDQEQLRNMASYCTPSEVTKYVDSKPFIFLQMLIMDRRGETETIRIQEWKTELVAQFCDCVTKNSKIAIARTETENIHEIEFYRSCGFFTMHDMDIPSYSSSKGADITVLAYTPLGKEGTAEIFKKFYSMGARF